MPRSSREKASETFLCPLLRWNMLEKVMCFAPIRPWDCFIKLHFVSFFLMSKSRHRALLAQGSQPRTHHGPPFDRDIRRNNAHPPWSVTHLAVVAIVAPPMWIAWRRRRDLLHLWISFAQGGRLLLFADGQDADATNRSGTRKNIYLEHHGVSHLEKKNNAFRSGRCSQSTWSGTAVDEITMNIVGWRRRV